jgi:hypothetical protein
MKTRLKILSVAVAVICWQIHPVVGQDSLNARSPRPSNSKARDSIPPLFIEFSPATREQADTMEEDLSVMARLIDKALDQGLGEDMPPVKLNLPMLYTSSGRSVRAMYLEGFGALFMVKVNFPVVAPPKVETRPEPASTNSEWDQVKTELREQDEQETDRIAPTLDLTRGEFDASQVESLKKALLQSLKHASHIRTLKPDEFVAVSVFGSDLGEVLKMNRAAANASPAGIAPAAPPASNTPTSNTPKKKAKADANELAADFAEAPATGATARPGQPAELSAGETRLTRALVRITSKSSKSSAQGTVLTLRVKKSDVDAFTKGQLNLETFQKKAVFNAYVGNGYGVLSVNSWAGSSKKQ